MFILFWFLLLSLLFLISRPQTLGVKQVRFWYLLIFHAIFYYFLTKYASTREWGWSLITRYNWVSVFSYLFLLVMGFSNWRLPGFSMISFGLTMNFLAMAFNGGRMPVLAKALLEIGQSDFYLKLLKNSKLDHVLLTDQTKFQILADRIPLDTLYVPFETVVSIGDLLIFAGISWFFVSKILESNSSGKRMKNEGSSRKN